MLVQIRFSNWNSDFSLVHLTLPQPSTQRTADSTGAASAYSVTRRLHLWDEADLDVLDPQLSGHGANS